LINQTTSMNHSQTLVRGNPTEKSGYLSLAQIAHLIAQAVVDQHQSLTQAHSSWVYATDRDKFLDFHAHQSVNTNPSNNPEVQP
jgi:4-aminobutyrate aminotransferase-like enzyme